MNTRADAAGRPEDSSPDIVLGVGVVIRRAGRYLLGHRKNAHGAGTWGFPGGKVDPGEDPFDAATRELREETGLLLHEPLAAGWSTGWLAAGRLRHLTLFVAGTASGEPEVREPDKCGTWRWFARHELPSPLFAPTRDFFAARSGRSTPGATDGGPPCVNHYIDITKNAK